MIETIALAVGVYLVMCGLLLALPCIRMNRGFALLVLLSWTLAYAVWYLFSPVYAGAPIVIKSAERPVVSNGVVRNWGDTVACRPKIFRAHKEADIYDALDSPRLRVVGSTHSWSALVCSDEAVLIMDYCNMSLEDDVVKASAACKIADVQTFLGEKGKMLHGFGSIMGQTIAGASLTSLHGAQFDMFTTHVVKMEAILADKTKITVEGADLPYWKSSMGMLGVLTDVYVQTFPHSSVQRDAKIVDFEAAMNYLNADDLHGLTITGVLEHGSFYVETFSDVQRSEFDGLKEHSPWLVFAYDNVAQPLLMLFGRLLKPIDIVKLVYAEDSERVDMNHAWAHIAGFTSGSGSEYSVPLSECKRTLEKIRDMDKFSHVYIRKIHRSTDVLSFAPQTSCAFDPYLFYTYNYAEDYQEYMHAVENIVKEAGGKTHWGKKYHTAYDGLIPQSFKDYRASKDPQGKFMNNFTQTMLDGGTYAYKPVVAGYRAIVWLVLFWGSALLTGVAAVLPAMTYARAVQTFLATLTLVLAWISVVIHDNNFVDGHLHSEHHEGIPWSLVWLIVAGVLAALTAFKYSVRRLRLALFVGAGVDAFLKLNCDECNHGLSTLLMALSILATAVLDKYNTNREIKYMPL